MIVQGGKASIAPTTYSKLGSDCAGSSGTANRTLDLADEAANEIIFVQGSFLHPTQDYTKALVGGVSRYTFINKVYNNFFIEVFYWT